MKSVLMSEYKKNKLPFIIINIIALLIISFYIFMSNNLNIKGLLKFNAYIFSIISLIYIFLNFSYNKKKDEADFYYSINITRKKLFISKYVFTILEISLSFLIYFIITNLLIWLYSLGINFFESKNVDGDSFKYLLGVLLQYIFTISFFNWILFFYMKAFNVIDGIIYSIVAGFIPHLFELSLSNLLWFFNIPTPIEGVLLSPSYYSIEYLYNGISGYGTFLLIFFLILSFVLIGLMYYLQDKKSAENIGHIDNDVLGYRFLIPFCVLSATFYFTYYETVQYGLLLIGTFAILEYIGFVIKNRSFIIHKYDLLNISITSLVSLIIVLLLARY